jgi:aminopeptidase N
VEADEELDRLTQDDARTRAGLLSRVRYQVGLDLTDDVEVATFKSRTVIEFDCSTPGERTFINLTAASVDSIVLNGRTIPVSAFKDNRIELDGLAAHNRLEIVANCNYDQTGVGLHRKQDPSDGKVYCYTHFEPFDAHRVFPAFDQPDLKAEFTFEVNAPPQWTVISNENGVRRDAGAQVTTSFGTTRQISTYLAAIIAGPYKEITTTYKGVEITIYTRESMFQYAQRDGAEIFEITKKGLDYYEKMFGRKYPFSKYAHIFVPEFNAGAMEHPGAVTYNEVYLYRSTPTEAQLSRRADVILHEMAHMWFGDLVTMKWWNDLWLNESFATVMALFAQIGTNTYAQRAVLDFADGDKAWALDQDQLSTTHPIASLAKDTLEADQNFDGITYAKGAAVLRQLLAWLGEDVVFGGLKEYFQTYEWSTATLDDLLGVWQKHAGPDRDVFGWAKLWLTTTGPNTLTGRRVDSRGNPGFSIVQSPAGDPQVLRPHRVTVGAYRLEQGKLVRVKRVAVDIEGAVTDVPEIGAQGYDLILVNDEDLTYAKVRLDAESRQTVIEHVGDIDEPLPRMLVWTSAWDMVRDAEMPARDFAAMVAQNIEAETDPDNVRSHMDSASAAIAAYGDQANYAAAVGKLADLALSLLRRAEAGSLMQLSAAKLFVGEAESQAHLEYVRDLYTGAQTLPGLDVEGNIDLQWQMTTALATGGMATETLIDAQAARDKTNIGADRALLAKAARPDASIKAAAWKRILEDRTLSLKSYQALIHGFTAADHQYEYLLDEYIDKYVAELPKVWKNRTLEEAEAFTTGLFPRYRGRAQILALAEQLAARKDLPKPALRQLAEIRDGVVRKARAQALDRQSGLTSRGVA